MIDLYTFGTPNGKKASIMLEEVGLAYNVHIINIMKDDQFAPDFLKISPNNKIPAIVDPDGPGGEPLALFESGAILIYLAEKCAREDLLPTSGAERYAVMQWLMWQMGGFGPMLGQAHHFLKFAKEDVPYAKKRYGAETARLYKVLNAQLADNAFMAGDVFSIADIATYPWADRHPFHQIDLADYPHVKRWYDKVSARESVEAGMNVPTPPPQA
ncbi:glutathione binding-like protein [Magnetovibrio sp. PR-2]|uniref:glutathione S-transferase family protein n=1 Tax=Magnetovibrio sp. PR-2 TaxID=3120356 RepID=UPI002FCE50AD